jgi:hypothetical protein
MRPLGGLRRDTQSLSQVLQRARRVYQSTPAFHVDSDVGAARPLRSTDVTPLRRYYEPSHRRVHGEFLMREHSLGVAILLVIMDCAGSDLAVLFLHLMATVARLARPGGARSVVAESVLVK